MATRITISIPAEHKGLRDRLQALGINVSAVCTAALLAAAEDPSAVPVEHRKPLSLQAEVEMLRDRVAALEVLAEGRS